MNAPPRIPRRGRTAARFTPEQVREIRSARLIRGVVEMKLIARQLGVSHHTVIEARRGRTYRWVA